MGRTWKIKKIALSEILHIHCFYFNHIRLVLEALWFKFYCMEVMMWQMNGKWPRVPLFNIPFQFKWYIFLFKLFQKNLNVSFLKKF